MKMMMMMMKVASLLFGLCNHNRVDSNAGNVLRGLPDGVQHEDVFISFPLLLKAKKLEAPVCL